MMSRRGHIAGRTQVQWVAAVRVVPVAGVVTAAVTAAAAVRAPIGWLR